MPTRITPLDVKAFCSHELFRKGEQIFENQLVKHRFQTHYGLQATVRSNGTYRVEMIVDGEQLFGRCTCHAGSTPCEHQVATLLAWLNESTSFISYQDLRKAIRSKDKNSLVDIFLNLVEIFPELSQFFISTPGLDPTKVIREEVADVFDLPLSQKIDPQEILKPCQILLVRSKQLRNEGQWNLARTLLFEILNRTLALIDHQQTTRPFRENFVLELADEFEDLALNDPDFETHRDDMIKETIEILDHDSSEMEGIFLDPLKEKLGIEKRK
ncbi:hypothetical protein GF406_17570 [candidate division KSB1 bacterium]|jgi:hypothetical protein|nr:hypothetical protein [candidate division KSB1 bacterium]